MSSKTDYKISVIEQVNFSDLCNGLYIIHWSDGEGKSLAAFHRDHRGHIRFQCTNWVSTTTVSLEEYLGQISYITLVMTDADEY